MMQNLARLAAPIALLSALVMAAGSACYVRNTHATVAEILPNHVASVRAAQELEISIREVRAQMDRYLISGDCMYLGPVPGLRERTAATLSAAETLATTPSEQAMRLRVRQGHDHFFAEYERAIGSPPAQGLYLSITELTDNVLNREILEPAHEYLGRYRWAGSGWFGVR